MLNCLFDQYHQKGEKMNKVASFTRRFGLLPLGLSMALGATGAVDPGFGSECAYSGSTLANGGAPSSMSGACAGNSIESHGTVYGSVWTGDDYFDYSFAQGALTAASASAGLGSLHAYSHSAATSTPEAYIYTDNNNGTQLIENDEKARGNSAAWASFHDTITVKQGTVYGPVVLRFSLALSGSTAATASNGTGASLYARLIADDDRYADDLWVTLNQQGQAYSDRGYWPGTTIKISGYLSASTEAFAGRVYLNNGWVRDGYVAAAEATANASNTAGFRIEALTDGASYTSASGHDYVTAVPEPASAWLLGLGALGLLGLVRRRQSLAAGGH